MTEATLFIKVLYSWIGSWNQPVLGNKGNDSGRIYNLPITSLTTLCCIIQHSNSILCILPVAFTQSFLYSSTNSIFLSSRWGHYLWVGCLWTPSPGSFIYYSGLTRYVLNTSPFFSLPKFNKKDKNSSSLFQEENFLIGFVTYVLSQNLF